MTSQLAGHSILIVDDDFVIAFDLADAFACAGARAVRSGSLYEALRLVEAETWAAAVLDHILAEGDGSELCERLTEREVPFVLYTGRTRLDGACGSGVQVFKPANPEKLVELVEGLVRSRGAVA
jgi:DNA-binding response OmpR family regulator